MKNRIRVLRAEYKHTQIELSEALGLGRNTVHHIENESVEPNLSTMQKIAKYYKKKVEEVFDINDEW